MSATLIAIGAFLVLGLVIVAAGAIADRVPWARLPVWWWPMVRGVLRLVAVGLILLGTIAAVAGVSMKASLTLALAGIGLAFALGRGLFRGYPPRPTNSN